MYGTHSRANELETADEYARLEDCFRDHRAAPFKLDHHIPPLRCTAFPTGADGFVNQTNLHRARIAAPPILFEHDFISSPPKVEFSSVLTDDIRPSESAWSRIPIKHLKLACDDLDLGSDPSADYNRYLDELMNKCSCDLTGKWLPICRLRTESDEGLGFPSVLSRLQLLIYRELDRECIPAIPELDFEGKLEHRQLGRYSEDLRAHAETGQTKCMVDADHMTPPLTPVNDTPSPYVPDNGTTVIDLTSEPSTPVIEEVENIRRDFENGHIDSDPATHSTSMRSSPSQLPYLLRREKSEANDFRIEVPLISSTSDMRSSNSLLADIGNLATDFKNHAETLEVPQEGFFEDAISTIFDANRINIMREVEQEAFDVIDSMSRVSVPVLSFDFPPPAWNVALLSAEEQFRWILHDKNSKLDEHITGSCSDGKLKWVPISPRAYHDPVTEEAPCCSDLGRDINHPESTELISSADHAYCPEKVLALSFSDEDIEDLLPPLQSLDKKTLCEDPARQLPVVTKTTEFMEQEAQGDAHYGPNLLPKHDESHSTEGLLSSFMQLRPSKKPRLGNAMERSFCTKANNARSKLPQVAVNLPEEIPNDPPKALVPAPTPTVEIPREKGCFIVSFRLERQLLHRIEQLWPADHLIDRDHLKRGSSLESVISDRAKMSVPPPECEVDIALTATAGIVVTNLLKIRQKALPGSKSQASFRTYIQMLAQKYETLFVLVTENNCDGEYVGTPSPTELAGFTDFVVFTTMLDRGITTILVPGAEATLASWILALMCRYSTESSGQKQFLSPIDTTWEMFLRRTGMNVVAAQMLAGAFQNDAGSKGLANFLDMSLEERILRYGNIVGSKNILIASSAVMDQQWA